MSLVGELNDLGLSDIFQILALSQRTGTLRVTTPQFVGQALFASGMVVGGGLSDHSPMLGSYFVEQGLMTHGQAQDLVADERRGLVGTGLLQRLGPEPDPFLAAMEQLLRRIMNQLLVTQEGSFSFENAPSMDPWEHFSVAGTMAICPKGLQAQYLAMEAMRLRDEAQAQRPPAQVPSQAQLPQDGPRDDDWSALLGEVDGPRAQPSSPAPPRRPVAAAPSNLADLRDVMQQLQRLPAGTNPSSLLLRALQLHCERGAYFELRGGHLVGRGGFGRIQEGEMVPPPVEDTQVRVPLGSALGELLAHGQPQLGPLVPDDGHRALLAALGGGWHQGAVLMAPWRAGGRVVGLLVGDNPSGQPLTDAPGVDILMAQVGGGALRPLVPGA